MVQYTGYLVLLGLAGLLHWSCAPKGTVGALTAQNSSSRVIVSPLSLYVGENEITVSSEVGLDEIRVEVVAGKPERIKVEGAGEVSGCPREWKLQVRVEALITENVGVRISGKNCLGNKFNPVYLQNQVWSVERVVFPEVEVGKRSCKDFKVTAGELQIVDSITVPASLPVWLGFEKSSLKFPLTIPAGKELVYTVCFTGEKPGEYIFPVTSWMRRKGTGGPFTNYPVSDTAVIRVRGK